MPAAGSAAALHVGMALARMTAHELFIAQLGLAGPLSGPEVERTVAGARAPTAYEHDVLAHALNEECAQQGLGHPVAASSEVVG